MRKIKTVVSPLEQRIVSEEYAKAKLEQQLHLNKIRQYQVANNSKNGGLL